MMKIMIMKNCIISSIYVNTFMQSFFCHVCKFIFIFVLNCLNFRIKMIHTFYFK